MKKVHGGYQNVLIFIPKKGEGMKSTNLGENAQILLFFEGFPN